MTYIHPHTHSEKPEPGKPGRDSLEIAISTGETVSKKLAEIIRTDSCLTLHENATVREATILMCRYHSGAVGIVDDAGRLVGLVTDRDILKKVISRSRDSRKIPVSDIMIRDPRTIDLGSDANAALDMVAKGGHRYLPVVDGERLVAILDVRDLYEEVRRVMAQAIDQKDMLLSFVFHEPYGGYPHVRHRA